MTGLVTTQGTLRADDLGLILPHEHIFVDLGPIKAKNWRDAEAEDVIELKRRPRGASARLRAFNRNPNGFRNPV